MTLFKIKKYEKLSGTNIFLHHHLIILAIKPAVAFQYTDEFPPLDVNLILV